MRRWPMILRAALLLAIAGAAGAQGEFNVTMRVVEDVRGLDAVVIVIGDDAVETRVDTSEPVEPAEPDGQRAPAAAIQ
jgi:hypothetical protein